MAGKRWNSSGEGHEEREREAGDPDIAVAPARRFALALMVVASAAALLATSDPQGPSAVYTFEKSSQGPRATLTASAPSKLYQVEFVVNALGPKGVNTAESALCTVHGMVTSHLPASARGASQFVRVRYGAVGETLEERSVLTNFEFSRPLRFSGKCSDPGQASPCRSMVELEVTLEGPEALSADGSVNVDWAIACESRAFKPNNDDSSSSDSLEAPWTLEIVER